MHAYVTTLFRGASPRRRGGYAVERVANLSVRVYADPREGPKRPAVDLAAMAWAEDRASAPTAPAAPQRERFRA